MRNPSRIIFKSLSILYFPVLIAQEQMFQHIVFFFSFFSSRGYGHGNVIEQQGEKLSKITLCISIYISLNVIFLWL